ncbi:MAG: YdcF family protein [Rhodospirillales bacterium]|nr:YdcF family protein [Rhodospirillales bacterium]
MVAVTPGRLWLARALPWLAGLALLWLGGLLWFAAASGGRGEAPAHTDGIVALTGGAGRVELALQLLEQGRADRLLISGVGRAATFAELAHRAGVDLALAPRVTLGRSALSTRGNAVETAAWARERAIGSLIVVTSYYHMPRAMAELSRTLPGVALHPMPVLPPGGAPLRLLVSEYTKFLAVELGLSRFSGHEDLSRPEPPANPEKPYG